MTVINTNVGALTARTYAVKANESMQKSMERLSSGLRINSAADDAAGLAVANKMESQLRGMNMAIRNSQDGISLVQTAEAGMGEITNMIIRMRELAVQMNNGVYTDSDRQNAQLEVTALLSEIDKIADNTAFNDVKVLDGSYSADIRAGNTNAEIINVAVKRMKTDALGGNTLAADSLSVAESSNIDTSAYRATKSVMTLAANEASKVIIKEADLSSEMVQFASGKTGTYSIAGQDSNLFNIVTSGGSTTFETQNPLNHVATDSNSYSFAITFTETGTNNTFTDNLTLNIEDNTSAAAVKASSSSLTVSESQGISFNAVDTTLDPNNAANNAGDGVLSTSLQTFVLADTATDGTIRGEFSISGADQSSFQIDANGKVTAAIDFEDNGSSSNTNAYSFNVVYTNVRGDEFVEAVTMNVTDSNEEVYSVNSPSVPSSVKAGDTFSIDVYNKEGTAVTTVTATVGQDNSNFSAGDVAAALNSANNILATPADVTFAADANGNITTTYNDSVGDVADRRVVTIADAGTSTSDRVSTQVAAAAGGASFSITVGSDTYTARVDAGAATGSFSMQNLVDGLNAHDDSGHASSERVSFSLGDNNSIEVKFDEQGTNTVSVGRVSYDADGSNVAAVERQVMLSGSALTTALAASNASGDSFTITINDGTSSSTYTYEASSGGDAVTTVADLATKLNLLSTDSRMTVTNVSAGDVTRAVTFSEDNGQLIVEFSDAGADQNDFTVSLSFADDASTASGTYGSATQIRAGADALGGSGTAFDTGEVGSTDTVAGFSAQALKYNAIELETGSVSTTTTGTAAVNQVITIDNAASGGTRTIAAVTSGAAAGDTFEVTIGGSSGATFSVTVGSGYSAGQYDLNTLAADLTAATRDQERDGGQRQVSFNFSAGGAFGNALSDFGAASEGFTVEVNDGSTATTYSYTSTSTGDTLSTIASLAANLNAAAAASNEDDSRAVTFSVSGNYLLATFDEGGQDKNAFTISLEYDDATAADDISAATGAAVAVTAGTGVLNAYNDATFSVSSGNLVVTLAYDGAVPSGDAAKASVTAFEFTTGGTTSGVGSTAAITTTGVNAVQRVESIASVDLGSEDFAVGDTLKVDVGSVSVSHTLTVAQAADLNGSSTSDKLSKIATHLSTAADTAGAGNTDAMLAFSSTGGGLRVTFETAGVNTDAVSGLKIDRAEVDKGTASKVSDGVNSLKAEDANEAGTGSVASNAADYGRNNSATGNNTDAMATAQLGGSYATGTGAQTIAATSTITNIVEAAKVQIGLDVLGSDFAAFRTANANGEFTIGGTDGSKFEVSREGVITNRAPMDFETTPNFSFDVTYTAKDGSSFTETVNLQLSDSQADAGDHLINVSVSTQALAGDSIAILDTALNQVSAAQAELGAIQNRLQHNIDNLTMGAMLTETSKGRITDADFAKETTQLSKQQILAQAATSMLAQANQSKQSVLSLLQ